MTGCPQFFLVSLSLTPISHQFPIYEVLYTPPDYTYRAFEAEFENHQVQLLGCSLRARLLLYFPVALYLCIVQKYQMSL